MTSQVARDDSHRFITDNLSNMTLAPAGTQTVTLSYDEIFPLTDAAVCTEVHPVSAGGCADGVCCKVSISMYTITDAIIMTSRVNNRKADGNPQFWKCEQEFQVPGVTNTEPTGEEIAAEILHGEADGEIDGECSTNSDCGTHAECDNDNKLCKCEQGFGRKTDDARNCFRILYGHCNNHGDCGTLTRCFRQECVCYSSEYEPDTASNPAVNCKNRNECTETQETCLQPANVCHDTNPGYYCDCNDDTHYPNAAGTDATTCTEKKLAGADCDSNEECHSNSCNTEDPNKKMCDASDA